MAPSEDATLARERRLGQRVASGRTRHARPMPVTATAKDPNGNGNASTYHSRAPTPSTTTAVMRRARFNPQRRVQLVGGVATRASRPT